jgi:hypothetical protein
MVLNVLKLCHGGVAQWTSHPPHAQKIRVRIPQGYKVFMESIAILLRIMIFFFHAYSISFI